MISKTILYKGSFLFIPITENQFEDEIGAHPAFETQAAFNVWIIQNKGRDTGNGTNVVSEVDFNGVLGFGNDETYYNAITDGSSVTISVSQNTTKRIGSYERIKINGDSDISIPDAFTFLGDDISIDPNAVNILNFWYYRENDIVVQNIVSGAEVQVDNGSPSVPSNLSVANLTETAFRLNWVASTDNIEVSHYRVFKDNVLYQDNVNAIFLDISELTSGDINNWAVSAVDTSGNESAKSTALEVETLSPGVIEPINPADLDNIIHDAVMSENTYMAFSGAVPNEIVSLTDNVSGKILTTVGTVQGDRPVFLNNELSFSTDEIKNNNPITTIGKSQDFEGFIIFKMNSLPTQNTLFHNVLASNNRFSIGLRDGNLAIGYYDTSFITKGVAFSDTASYHVLSYKNTSGVITAKLDGVLMNLSNVPTPSTSTPVISYGSAANAAFSTKRNSIVSGALTSTEKEGLIEFINQEYGIEINEL